MFVAEAEAGGTFDVTTLAEHAALFDRWVKGVRYKAGQIRIDEADGGMYRCLAEHEAKKSPSRSPDKWGFICNPANPWPEWFPYIGRDDAWMSGDKCIRDGKRWVSLEDYNVGEPGISGWKEVQDDV
jgi:hypothetical protein